jgi:hypothetical protein
VSTADRLASRSRRGQSFVEFALVLPMLIVLLLGIADFGRVFASGLILEASARNAAEVGSLERLRYRPPAVADPAYYDAIHALAATTACEESRELPTFDGSDACPDGAHDTSGTSTWFVGACVHDGADPSCGSTPTGYGAAPGECSLLLDPWSNSYEASVATPGVASYWVEVRLCYKFETLFNLHLALPMNTGLNLGDIWLQRSRTFVVDCPVGTDPADLTTNCPNP